MYDLCDSESTGFSVVANQMIKDINLNWSREVVLIIHVVVNSIFYLSIISIISENLHLIGFNSKSEFSPIVFCSGLCLFNISVSKI